MDGKEGMIRFRSPVRIASDPVGITNLCWFPEGQRLCYVRAGKNICVLDVRSAKERTVSEGATPSVSHDGRSLLFSRGGMLLRHDLERGEEREIVVRDRLVARAPKHSPLESPDGNKVAFQCMRVEDAELRRKRAHFWACDSDGGSPLNLAVEALGGSAVWSPDSSKLAVCNYEGGARLFVIRITGEREARFHGLCAAFSPDSKRIAYKNVGAIDVRALREGAWEQDSGPIAPLEGVHSLSFNPLAWLGLTSLLTEEGGRVWLIDLEKGATKPVVDVPEIVRRGCPTLAWKPDVSGFAAELEDNGGSALMLFAADTSAQAARGS